MLKDHQDDTDYRFIEDLLPWSYQLPEICRKRWAKMGQYSWFTVYFEAQHLNDCILILVRFHSRRNAYEKMTITDLIHDCIIKCECERADTKDGLNFPFGQRLY